MASRVCTECKASLRDRQSTARTCSESCRKKRTRRLAAQNKRRAQANRTPEHLEAVADAVTHKEKDVAHEVLKEELRPVVREAITDDVLVAIDKMVRLTPRMIDLIAADMEDPDANVRQKAYTLLARYTLGNQSVAPQPDAPSGTKVEVHFALPRPGELEEAVPAEAVEIKQCVECSTERPETDFVSGSDRCTTCHDALQARVRERFQ